MELLREFCLSDYAFTWIQITGPGGIGKSRLAYEFAKEVEGWKQWAVLRSRLCDSNTLNKQFKKIELNAQENICSLVILDYIKWNTDEISKWIVNILDRFQEKAKIRIILLERETIELGDDYPQKEANNFGYRSDTTALDLQEGVLNLKS